jgi:hypothetical protein
MNEVRGRQFETAPLEHSGEPLRRLDPDDVEAVFGVLQSEIAERGIPFFQVRPEADHG